MGVQLIFVVETNKKCNSDWIYIKDTVEQFYSYDTTQLKLSVVYMDGKGKYKKKIKEVEKLISQYRAGSKGNKSNVLFCFDCDEYDSKQEDLKFLEEAKTFCQEQDYEFVWFCKDIEQVYIGKKVNDNQKKNEAATFKAKKLIMQVKPKRLSEKRYKNNTSNILEVLDQYPELTRKIRC